MVSALVTAVLHERDKRAFGLDRHLVEIFLGLTFLADGDGMLGIRVCVSFFSFAPSLFVCICPGFLVASGSWYLNSTAPIPYWIVTHSWSY